jgi:hypothetical protein
LGIFSFIVWIAGRISFHDIPANLDLVHALGGQEFKLQNRVIFGFSQLFGGDYKSKPLGLDTNSDPTLFMGIL